MEIQEILKSFKTSSIFRNYWKIKNILEIKEIAFKNTIEWKKGTFLASQIKILIFNALVEAKSYVFFTRHTHTWI